MSKPRVVTGLSAKRGAGTAVLLGLLVLGAGRQGRAHIVMTAPADWVKVDSAGDPQKIAPCGVSSTAASSTYTPTNKVTTVHGGDQLMVTWTETVPHDGHFRISLAVHSRSELVDPAVTASNADGTPKSVAISTAYPVLADNLFPHQAASTPAGMTYKYTVTVPNTPCTKCTLQLLQFMAEHPADPSYFYHHCADVTILASGASPDAGAGTGGTPGTGGSHGTGGISGTGGIPGSGGVRGTGGSLGTGGVPGTGGDVGTGGELGTGGDVGTGGELGTGGNPGTGGEPATGGSPGEAGSTGATGAGGNPGKEAPPPLSGSGCSCQTAPAVGGLASLFMAALASVAIGRRARRRR